MTNKKATALERCPQCRQLPLVKVEDMGNYFDVVVQCEEHGHKAIGNSLESANRNWNTYVTLYTKIIMKGRA